MHTNLKTIVKFKPCSEGIAKLMNNLGYKYDGYNWEDVYNSLSKEQQNKSINFKFILESNGVKDTFWGLCTQPKKTRMLIGADIVESVLYIYEKHYPNDNRMRDWIQGIRDYCDNKITKAELNALKTDAYVATGDTIYDAATAATAATNAVNATVYDTANAAAAAAYDTANAVAAYAARKEQWKKNEEILLKYI